MSERIEMMMHGTWPRLLVAGWLAFAAPLYGQAPPAPGLPTKAWQPPRTPDGRPDMQGTWTNASVTPFERPPELKDKPFLTEAEALAWERLVASREDDAVRPPTEVADVNEFWLDPGRKALKSRQSSLVVDPPDGIVPVRPEAEARKADNLLHNADWTEYMSVWDRCITRGVPGSIFPASYNNGYQILQAPGHVVIRYEMIHDARIIPIDAGAHVGASIRQWMGDSRGHWEGDTLVVDVTNFNGRSWMGTSSRQGRMRGIQQSDASHIVERFTMIDADTIQYEATVDDPKVFTRPWKVAFPLTRADDYDILEYACHEGNYAVPNILRGGRAAERAAGAAAADAPSGSTR